MAILIHVLLFCSSAEMECELKIHRDCDPSQKSRSLNSSSCKGHLTRLTLQRIATGRKRRRLLAQGVERSVEDDHLEDIHDDTLDTINVVTSKFDTVVKQNELIGQIPSKDCGVVIRMEGQGNDTVNTVEYQVQENKGQYYVHFGPHGVITSDSTGILMKINNMSSHKALRLCSTVGITWIGER